MPLRLIPRPYLSHTSAALFHTSALFHASPLSIPPYSAPTSTRRLYHSMAGVLMSPVQRIWQYISRLCPPLSKASSTSSILAA
ncbi:hypothetical protein BDD12DRAFT_838517 [Trichophaea hybrida]|nr:hypothetical protein BDD12DRAFT_838517 [Trichophaea hybrida]